MKSKDTLNIERALAEYTDTMSVYGCKEVSLRNPAYEDVKERVDYITFDTKGIIRCYEIKVSKEDLYSDNNLSYWGDYNYLVMPKDMYDELIEEDKTKDAVDSFTLNFSASPGVGVISVEFDKVYGHYIFRHEMKAHKKLVSIAGKVQILESIARSACKQLQKYYY